jgi:ubiquinone/menaquinone biosynthesis C-methylase UbiE
MQAQATGQRRFRVVPEMEGPVARWYARLRRSGSQMAEYREQASRLTAGLPGGADVLEVAPGPGYLAVEMARLGPYRVTGLDISRTFVEIAGEQAREAGVTVDFRQGDVARMPFEAGSFDLIVCQAAFKNFVQPVTALDEMHRVLRPGGSAVILDLSREATGADINAEVARMELSVLNAATTRMTLRMLRRRAHPQDTFRRLAAESAFGRCDLRTDGVSLEVRLTRPAAA